MHSFWKVSRGWFSDEHPTEFSGDSVESLNLILLYFRRSSSGSTPCKAVLGSFPQHICSCCSLPTCRQHSWTKYQQDYYRLLWCPLSFFRETHAFLSIPHCRVWTALPSSFLCHYYLSSILLYPAQTSVEFACLSDIQARTEMFIPLISGSLILFALQVIFFSLHSAVLR